MNSNGKLVKQEPATEKQYTTEEKLEATVQELKQVKQVLGTLISWLSHDIGRHNVDNLLMMLNSSENKHKEEQANQ